MVVDFSVILASLRAAKATADQFTDLPMKAALIDLHDKVLAAKDQAYEMQDELRECQSRIRELEEALVAAKRDPREGLQFDKGVWWASESREYGPDGPFCTNCLDDGSRRMMKPDPNGQGHAQCLKCDTWFYNSLPRTAEDSPPARNRTGRWLGNEY